MDLNDMRRVNHECRAGEDLELHCRGLFEVIISEFPRRDWKFDYPVAIRLGYTCVG